MPKKKQYSRLSSNNDDPNNGSTDQVTTNSSNNSPPHHSSSSKALVFEIDDHERHVIGNGVSPSPFTPTDPAPPPSSSSSLSPRSRTLIISLLSLTLLVSIIATTLISRSHAPRTLANSNYILAHGSCTSYYVEELPIFTSITTHSNPDAWIWTGDIVYLDDPITDCDTTQPSWWDSFDACSCDNTDNIKIPSHSCGSGDWKHAERIYDLFLGTKEYRSFVEHFCGKEENDNGNEGGGGDDVRNELEGGEGVRGAGRGEECDKPILGIYDDHDFGWNDGNIRLPDRQMFKELYLDAIGVPATSTRRGFHHGAETWYRIREGVEVWVLDERWNRDPLPCGLREDWCGDVVQDDDNTKKGWCEDYLDGGCCPLDRDIYNGYCKTPSATHDPLYPYACDHASHLFGTLPLTLDPTTNTLNANVDHEDVWGYGFCSMLGAKQREWLRRTILESTAEVKIVVSGSVLLSNPTWSGDRGHCSGDDWDCYTAEQKWLIHLLMESGDKNEGRSPIVLAGDYHFSDLKRICPGPDQPYAEALGTSSLPPSSSCVFQHMASGMSHTTAIPHTNCEYPEYLKDRAGLRGEAGQDDCSIVQGPNWGEIEINDKEGELTMKIREGVDGAVVISTTLDIRERFKVKRSKTYTLG